MTQFAPAERQSQEAVLKDFKNLENHPLVQEVINAMPLLVIILNEDRQILYSNKSFMDLLGLKEMGKFLGKRPGEAINCIHSRTNPGGCGCAEACRYCGAVTAILEAQRAHRVVNEEVRLTVNQEGEDMSLDLSIQAKPFSLDGRDWVIASLTDVSDQKRRKVFERLFFHDIINAAGGLKGLSELMAQSEIPQEFRDLVMDMNSISNSMLDEIIAQRELSAAENGELNPVIGPVSLGQIAREAADTLAHHPVAAHHAILMDAIDPGLRVETDRTLAWRVLVNMIKNSLEASPAGAAVTVRPFVQGAHDGFIGISVHNEGLLPDAVRAQIFQRSFSTKGSNRGLGTYSMKLFAEHYLHGRVSFTSSSEEGTVFSVELPVLPS